MASYKRRERGVGEFYSLHCVCIFGCLRLKEANFKNVGQNYSRNGSINSLASLMIAYYLQATWAWFGVNVHQLTRTYSTEISARLIKLCNMQNIYIWSKYRRLAQISALCAGSFHHQLHMLNICESDRKWDTSRCLQTLEDVKEEELLIERIQPQVSHYTQDGVN